RPRLERNLPIRRIDDDAATRGRRSHQLRVLLRPAEFERVVGLSSADVPLPGDRELLRSGGNGEHRRRDDGTQQRRKADVVIPHLSASPHVWLAWTRSWRREVARRLVRKRDAVVLEELEVL